MLTHPVLAWDRTLSPVQHQFQVLKRAGVVHYEDQAELWPQPTDDRYIEKLFQESGIVNTKPLVGLVLGSSPRWPTKRWFTERFLELSKQLIKKSNCQVALLGTPEDEPLAKVFEQAGLKHVFNFTGKTTLTQLVSLVKRLNVLVTGDTAPLHMASAFETKIVALFGPTEPNRHMPPGKNHIALVKRVPCQPCYSGTCQNSEKLICLQKISVEEVFEAVQKQLA